MKCIDFVNTEYHSVFAGVCQWKNVFFRFPVFVLAGRVRKMDGQTYYYESVTDDIPRLTDC